MPSYSWILPILYVCIVGHFGEWKRLHSKARYSRLTGPPVNTAGFWDCMPSETTHKRGRHGMKLNMDVNFARRKKLTSNKTKNQRETAALPDDLPSSAALPKCQY